MIRTRFAPSPTGMMHVGGLRTALYEYLIAKHSGGKFILRIEDTDQRRYVEGATEVIYDTLRVAGIMFDEGPGIGGPYGPYIQSERKNGYLGYAKQLVEKGKAYYCFCSKERLESLHEAAGHEGIKYDRKCLGLTKEEAEAKLADAEPYVIRQIIPEGVSVYNDMVYGEIKIDNAELEDQILIKSDGMPTYNFANVVDDHEMAITHVVRGNEYLSSTPKYNLLYEAFGWEQPVYVHLPLIVNADGKKLSKRKDDPSFTELLEQGFMPEAVVNFTALLGWSPEGNAEFFTMGELIEAFDIRGLSKSPSYFDMQKLRWMNGEYIKRLPAERFCEMALPYLRASVKRSDIDLQKVAGMVQSRVELARECAGLVDFIDRLPEYSTELYVHRKMKTDANISLRSLERILPALEALEAWDEENLHAAAARAVEELGVKNGQVLWPLRTALSGKPTSPCGATELAALLGKEDSLKRIRLAIAKLKS